MALAQQRRYEDTFRFVLFCFLFPLSKCVFENKIPAIVMIGTFEHLKAWPFGGLFVCLFVCDNSYPSMMGFKLNLNPCQLNKCNLRYRRSQSVANNTAIMSSDLLYT